ncbi:hypothetical protein CBS101457_005239 [Exobasidium rhododendri]|nr:hypothetical protein CBS101457_005239 [Exobasidium rhododendri]
MAPQAAPEPLAAAAAGASEEAGPSAPPPRKTLYCSICSFPPEYCEFSSSTSKCKTWLESAHPKLYKEIWGEEAITQKMSNMTTKQAEDLEKDAVKKEKKAEAKAEKEKRVLASSRIILTKMSRTKKKATTSIYGLHLFSPPLPALKAVAKGLSSRLATGASVSKSTANPTIDEIIIQGDVAEEVKDLIVNRTKPFDTLPKESEGGLPANNIVIEEEKKKKVAKEGEEEAEE